MNKDVEISDINTGDTGLPTATSEPIGDAARAPSGLELLQETDHLFVRQCVDAIEFLRDAPNKYEILEKTGKRIYFAAEAATSCWIPNCFTGETLKVSVLDENGIEVFSMHGSPGSCWNSTVQVSHGPTALGSIKEHGCWCSPPTIRLRNPAGEVQFLIKGQKNTSHLCDGTMAFDVREPNGTNIGKICKKWDGGELGQEMLTSTDNFGISFPVTLDTSMKALLLAATLILDYQFFEKRHH